MNFRAQYSGSFVRYTVVMDAPTYAVTADPLLKLTGLQSDHVGPVDLELAPGALLLIAGPSGAGKSLLLRAIADLDPHRGQVWLAGQPRATIPPALWRRQVGYLPADPVWWADTVDEHLTGVQDDWLQQLGFTPEVRQWEVERLSSGERQRLALARMLGNGPRVLLLDEATANLDPENTLRMEALVMGYVREREAGAIWVSHDHEQRDRLGGRLLMMDQGRLADPAMASRS